MKKITSLILAMAMVFSLSAQVFALNDDMQDNENSEANMIVITTSKEERDKQFNDAMAKVMEQLEGPTLTRDNKERFKYEHFDYQYKTLKGYAGNQLSGGYKFPTGGGFYFSDSGGPNVSGSVSLSLPAPYNFVSISVGLGNRSTTSGLYVTVPNKTDYFKLYVEKEMEVRPYAEVDSTVAFCPFKKFKCLLVARSAICTEFILYLTQQRMLFSVPKFREITEFGYGHSLLFFIIRI